MFGNPEDDEEYDSYYEDVDPDEGYVTKDSGKRARHSDGVVRDKAEDKPRFDLLFPRGVPFEDQLITRVADLYERGAGKYGARNWEKSESEDTLEHHEAALMRHVVRFLCGVEDGEDHAAAVVWNVNAVDLTRRKIMQKNIELGVPVRRNFFDWLWEDGDAVFRESRSAANAFSNRNFWRYDGSGSSPAWVYAGGPDPVKRSPLNLLQVFGALAHVDKHGRYVKFDREGNYVE